jgi:hypothetical protein
MLRLVGFHGGFGALALFGSSASFAIGTVLAVDGGYMA